MPRHKFIVMCNAEDGEEDAFNRAYDHDHIPDILDTVGFVSAERYRLSAGMDTYRYLTIYEIDAVDPAAALVELRSRLAAGEIRPAPGVDRVNAFQACFSPLASVAE